MGESECFERRREEMVRRQIAARGVRSPAVLDAMRKVRREGFVPSYLGELCRREFGDAVYSIGFGTDHGTVAAASHWDGPMELKAVQPARDDSYVKGVVPDTYPFGL
ncbi:MAG: erythromycin esterase family protein [Deltaproteobacteria bacterium]|nr:erythromycin esterase family protein [Deltaproteobacteria bacterium]